MKSREFDPRRLDVAALAKDGASVEGEWPFESLTRLAASSLPDAGAPPVRWRLAGELRHVKGSDAQVWLHAEAGARVHLECQRCLKPMAVDVAASRDFLFVNGEDAAAEMDADVEEDVLALTRALDALELVEDELLLELPLVPRHDVCPDPLPVKADALPEDDTPHPFAKLAALKRGGLPN
jgi:uncharacterized protein